MEKEDILTIVKAVFKESFGVDPVIIRFGAKPEDIPGWDSLGHATLTSNLEKKLNITFDIDELMEMENVDAIINIISGKM
jgi:acyl carrier protein